MSIRKKVLVFRELPADQLARLQAEHDVTVANPKLPEQRAAFDAALPTAQGLIGSSYPITADLLAMAPRLEVISSVSVGVDNYALATLHQRGIKGGALFGQFGVGDCHVVFGLQARQVVGEQLAENEYLFA